MFSGMIRITPSQVRIMRGCVNTCGALKTPTFEISGQAFESSIVKRNCVAVTVGKRRIRLYPIVVCISAPIGGRPIRWD